MNRINHKPLNPARHEIRVLEIERSNDPGSLVRCKVHHVPLNSSYTALSYVWGDPNDTGQIIVDDSPTIVTRSLAAALHNLRQRGYTLVWADAICINQQDQVEKTSQIQLMREIYVGAQSVFAWLGLGHDDSDSAFDYLSAAAKQNMSQSVPMQIQQALNSLFSRPYWERCWIIQELALNKNVVVQCGGRSIPWEYLAEALPVLGRQQALGQNIMKLINLEDFRDDAQNYRRVSLLSAICKSTLAKSTDPRDRVFALLGLVDDARHIVPFPDYTRSHWDIMLDITQRFIGLADNLAIIPMFGHGLLKSSTHPNTPTWAPQWFGMDPETGRRALSLQEKLDLLNRGRKWDATRGTRPDYRIQGSTLLVKGTIIDEIQNISTCLGDHQGSQQHIPKPQPSANSSNPYGSTDMLWISLIRCLDLLEVHWQHASYEKPLSYLASSDLNLGPQYYRSGFQKAFKDLYSSNTLKNLQQTLPIFRAWLEHNSGLPVANYTLRSVLKGQTSVKRFTGGFGGAYGTYGISKMLGKDGDRAMSTESAAKATFSSLRTGNRLVVTKANYVGWAVKDARPNDKICLLSGCSVPVVARPTNNGTLQMVGMAWIEGAMSPPPENSFLSKASSWPILKFE